MSDVKWVVRGSFRRPGLVYTATAVGILACLTVGMLTSLYLWYDRGWEGAGRYVAVLLTYPLHLLPLSVLALAASVWCWWVRARPAALLFIATALITLTMVIVPSSEMWRFAGINGVSLSSRNYVSAGAAESLGTHSAMTTVVYGVAADGTELQLDVWQPEENPTYKSSRAAIVFIHGGSWVHGSRGSAPDLVRWLNGLGHTVFDIDYRLPPHARWRDEVGDVKCALGWVAGNMSRYGLPSGRLIAMGSSAGGNLAMLAAYSAADPQLPPTCGSVVRVDLVVNFYGPADLSRLYDVSGTAGLIQGALDRYIGGSPARYPERYELLSPINHVNAVSPPTMTLHGALDRVVPAGQARELDNALKQAGVTRETWILPAQDHAFDLNWGGFGAQFARQRIESFIRENIEFSDP